jgi:hypothetical protein
LLRQGLFNGLLNEEIPQSGRKMPSRTWTAAAASSLLAFFGGFGIPRIRFAPIGPHLPAGCAKARSKKGAFFCKRP